MNQMLREELQNPDKTIRSRAAISLNEDVGALDALIRALAAEKDVMVREDITWALVRMGDLALLPLIHMLYDDNPAARHHAAHTLGKIGDARAVSALIGTLKDNDETVRSKAAFALGQIGDNRAVPALTDLLGSDDDSAALANILEGFGSAVIEPLAQALDHERWQVREQAAEILGILGDPDAEDALVGALRDPQWQVRFAAVDALRQFNSKNAKHALKHMMDDPDERVRGLAARAVARMRG